MNMVEGGGWERRGWWRRFVGYEIWHLNKERMLWQMVWAGPMSKRISLPRPRVEGGQISSRRNGHSGIILFCAPDRDLTFLFWFTKPFIALLLCVDFFKSALGNTFTLLRSCEKWPSSANIDVWHLNFHFHIQLSVLTIHCIAGSLTLLWL